MWRPRSACTACRATGALIVAPQGNRVHRGVLGAMQAGFIAVPLAVPVPGLHDERPAPWSPTPRPSVVLTTTGVHIAAQYVDDGAAVIAAIAVDTMGSGRRTHDRHEIP